MSISRISESASQLGGIEELLRKQTEKQTEELAQDKVTSRLASVGDSVKAASTGVMSANFASADSEMSRYVEARHLGAAEMQAIKQSVSAQIWAAADRLGGMQGRSRQYVEREQLREALHESNKEIRDDIESKAQEAQAPKDAEGNPIQTAASGNATPMPEIAGGGAQAAAPKLDAPEVKIATPDVSIDINV